MPDQRPLTVSELVFRLADFEGDEPVYFGDHGPVRSAERVWDSAGAVVVLSASPARDRQAARVSLFAPRRWWRAVAEAVRGLADARVSRGTIPPPPRPTCPDCHQEIDPGSCWCGETRESHRWVYDHPFVPLGCDCYRAKPREDP